MLDLPPLHGIPSFRVRFGAAETRLHADSRDGILDLKMPHLAGPAEEIIGSFPGQLIAPAAGTLLLAGEDRLAGAFVRPLRGALDEIALGLYRELLAHTRGFHLARVWNYVPDINCESTGLENYRRFNLGRWQAFNDAFGPDLHDHLPAASAVGLNDDRLVSLFIATRSPVQYVENPEQVPAWKYPADYGPKSPSFARASLSGPAGHRHAWISGTAAIKGHESTGIGDPARQVAVTLDNLGIITRALGFPCSPSSGSPAKVYLRHPSDLSVIQGALASRSFGSPESLTFLQADICRRELDVEIELAASESAPV